MSAPKDKTTKSTRARNSDTAAAADPETQAPTSNTTVLPQPLGDVTNSSSTVSKAKKPTKANAKLVALEARIRQECQAQLDAAVAREHAEAAERLAERDHQLATMRRIVAEANDEANTLDTVPKPRGSAGHGYSLVTAMGLETNKATYNDIIDAVHTACKEAKVDFAVSYKDQSPDKIVKVCKKVRDKHAFMKRFMNDWPIREMLKGYMKHGRDYGKKKAVRRAAQQAEHPLPAAPRRSLSPSRRS